MNSVIFWKKFLLKCFIVGLAFHIISFLLWFLMKDFSFAMAHQIFAINKINYNEIVINYFVASKLLIFYVFLTPYLALLWISKCMKEDWKKNIKLDD